MKITGIIAEYNPFHNGHAYQITKARELGADCVVAVCGGLFSQRGELSVCTKMTKARAAIAGGADLVLELPLCYTLSPAPDFARGGVEILNALGNVDFLAFGCEEQQPERLFELANFLKTLDNDDGIKADLKNGLSLSSARQKALERLEKPDFSQSISKPNNILALEYISALKKTNSKIRPMAIRRVGAEHNSGEAYGNFCSATKLREMLSEDFKEAEKFMPKECFDLLLKEQSIGRAPLEFKEIEKAVLFALRRLSAEEIRLTSGVSEGMENLIFKAIRRFGSFEEIVSFCSGKRYTFARIRRILMCSALGITREMSRLSPRYIRVLAFNQTGQKALKEAKNISSLPLVTKAAEIPDISPSAKEIFDIECRACDLVSLAFKTAGGCGLEMTENFFG